MGIPRNWSWHDDRQWAQSRLVKNGDKWFDQEQSKVFDWRLETRSEDVAGTSYRIGEMLIRDNKTTGEITMSLDIEDATRRSWDHP
jgi:hypothetical protein